MPLAPFGSFLASSLLPQILGGQQVGPAAPNPGNLGGGSGMQLPQSNIMSRLAQQNNFGNPLESAITPPASDQPQGFGAFFGNLDQNLQSPSKLLGLGLLDQIYPRLSVLGLLGGGIFGQNKVF